MLVRHAGTVIPAAMLVVFAAILTDAYASAITWERWLSYGLAGASSALGAYACFRIWRMSGRRHPSLFLLTLLYEKLALVPVFFVLVAASAEWVTIPGEIAFAIFVPASLGIAFSNLLLVYSLYREVLDEEVDPVPLRSLFSGRKRRRRS